MVRRARLRALGRPPALHAPPEWRWPAAAHAVLRADSCRDQPPRILLGTLAEPSVHRPQSVARCRKTAGLQIPPESPGEPPKRRLDMGLTPPERAKGSEPAPDGVLTRVDVAGRHPGNRLCCHGTGGGGFAAAMPPREPASWRAAGLQGPQEPKLVGTLGGWIAARRRLTCHCPREELSACDLCSSLMYPAACFGYDPPVAQRTYRKRFSCPPFY